MPHTGYGYVQVGAPMAGHSRVLSIERFVEKPDFDTASRYILEGNFYWNSGVFVSRAAAYLDELSRLDPTMHSLCKESYENADRGRDFIRLEKSPFQKIVGNSIDYAVMERTKKGAVIELNAGWDDVGSWSALYDISSKDTNGNVVKCGGKSELLDTHNCYINVKKTIAAIGLDNLVIVESNDALLVAKKDQVQNVKQIAEALM